jgi:predicted dehydrogenase
MSRRLHRRDFLRNASAAGLAAGSSSWPGGRASLASVPIAGPNAKLSIGVIGTSGRAAGNIAGVSGENIVAICDIDDRLLARAKEQFPRAETYNDFRKLIERKDLDAVVVSTADHTHAPASVMAMKLGKHVYCEKPLSHSVYEARVVAETAAKAKVATQMGTQIHASDNYRRVVEVIQSGAIGAVHEAHVWVGKTWSGGDRPKETPPVPGRLHWNLWLGPAPERPYHPTYLPANWRRWWDFGSGTLGDMACHYMDLPYWALNLKHPLSVEAEGPPVHPETTPSWMIVRYAYPSRGDMPPVALTWYDGGKRPELFSQGKLPRWGDGVLFIGDKGMLLADYDRYVLMPEADFKEFRPPAPMIAKSIGHHNEWIDACKTGRPTTCNFGYSGALTEAVLLGAVAYRLGRKLDWNAAELKAASCSAADRYIQREYRKGWTL